MKVYKIPVYRVNYCEGFNRGMLTYVDHILAVKKIFRVKEVMTGFDGITGVNHLYVRGNRLSYINLRPDLVEKNGQHFVAFMEDFTPDTLVSKKDCTQYVDEMEQSQWKKVYDEIEEYRQKEREKKLLTK